MLHLGVVCGVWYHKTQFRAISGEKMPYTGWGHPENEWVTTLPETNSSHLKIGRAPKENDRIPNIHFQVLLMLVSGRVTTMIPKKSSLKNKAGNFLRVLRDFFRPLCLRNYHGNCLRIAMLEGKLPVKLQGLYQKQSPIFACLDV